MSDILAQISDEMFARQEALEEEMRTLGVERYFSNVERNKERGEETSTRSVQRLLDKAVWAVSDGIKAFLEEAKQVKAGRKHRSISYLNLLEPEVSAYLAVKSILNSISDAELTMVDAAVLIANLLEDEVRWRAAKEAGGDRMGKFLDRVGKEIKGAKQRKGVVVKAEKRMYASLGMDEFETWPLGDKVNLGIKLIETIVSTTGLVVKAQRETGAKDDTYFIEATAETLNWIAKEDQFTALMSPVYLPTIIPPKPWTSPKSGGYWTRKARATKLVKTFNKAFLEELEHHEMPTVYSAVNAIQETPWSINIPVLEVARALWRSGSPLEVVPRADDAEIPAMPQSLDPSWTRKTCPPEHLHEYSQWKSQCRSIHGENAKMRAKRMAFLKMLWVADKFASEDEFYFPHQLDFRGRVYPIPTFLNPQGCDFSRGLLTFANAVPIGDQAGADWLAIHGAGLWGVDKVSMLERVDWVIQHEPEILAVAEDPLSCLFWIDADKPWQALAFCYEWAGYRAEGFDFLSSLPVQMDGTCNGLQNFSAMLRDPVGGAAVNLIPSDKPSDIYQKVADVVTAKVKRDMELHPDPEIRAMAAGWYGRVSRKVTKRPVMTMPYGSKQFGFRKQIYADVILRWKEVMGAGVEFPWPAKEGDHNAAWAPASYLGGIIWDSVGEVVVAARAAMEWLQKAAQVAAKEGLPVTWTTPAGLLVQQAYRKLNVKRLELTFEKVRLQVSVGEQTQELDKAKQASGISPNWVHSCDAAHMMLTVKDAHEKGIRSFSLIHDSYGTHAGNTWALAQALREQFVAMYKDRNMLEELASQLRGQLTIPDELPPVPPMGSLDLDLVLESAFFFA